MKLRIESIELVGTTRRVEFQPGLNLIIGPITTGKTKLLELCGSLIGLKLKKPTPEMAIASNAVAGQIVIDARTYQIYRPLVTTATAPVDVLGGDFSGRMPALQRQGSTPSFGHWLIGQLGLPLLEVPSAPTRPDSDPTPISIADYLNYCVLSQEEIDSNVLGHRDPFKNTKRKYVFEVLYGLYGVEAAGLQSELRSISTKIRALELDEATLERVLDGTPWESRSVLEFDLQEARTTLAESEQSNLSFAEGPDSSSRARELRSNVLELEQRIGDLVASVRSDTNSMEQLQELAGQLAAQSGRLTRSIVANELIVDFEFRTCPRCGAEVHQGRGDEGICLLCLQHPEPTLGRQDLVLEQARLERQIAETNELITARNDRTFQAQSEIADLELERAKLGADLEFESEVFVSDNADLIRQRAAERATLQETERRLNDYLDLFRRLDGSRSELQRLLQEREGIEAALEATERQQVGVVERLRALDENFKRILTRLHTPEIGDIGESYIHRETYLPIVNGRSFNDLSSLGLKVIVNLAHALAHHETAIEMGIPLPGLLIIDGPSSNIGREGEDLKRVSSIYDYLVEVAGRLSDNLQLIVVDNDVPAHALDFVRLELSEENRLVPV